MEKNRTSDKTKTSDQTRTLVGGELRKFADSIKKIPCLVVIHGDKAGQSFTLKHGENIVGRSPNADIFIDDTEMSRRHFKLTYRGRNVYIIDLGSTNGTHVNNQLISDIQRTKLSSSSFIQVGDAVLRLEFKSSSEIHFEDQILREARLDPLTGICNKKYFVEFAENIFTKSIQFARTAAVLLLDLDHFKSINDEHGHLGGDVMLKQFTDLINQMKHRNDLFARFGGEEFVIVLDREGITEKIAHDFAEELRAAVANQNFSYENKTVKMTVSIGVTCRKAGINLNDMLKDADKAMYEAKNDGRNKVKAA